MLGLVCSGEKGGGSTVCKHVFLKGLSTRLTDSSGNEGNHSMGVLSSS